MFNAYVRYADASALRGFSQIYIGSDADYDTALALIQTPSKGVLKVLKKQQMLVLTEHPQDVSYHPDERLVAIGRLIRAGKVGVMTRAGYSATPTQMRLPALVGLVGHEESTRIRKLKNDWMKFWLQDDGFAPHHLTIGKISTKLQQQLALAIFRIAEKKTPIQHKSAHRQGWEAVIKIADASEALINEGISPERAIVIGDAIANARRFICDHDFRMAGERICDAPSESMYYSIQSVYPVLDNEEYYVQIKKIVNYLDIIDGYFSHFVQ